MSTAPAGSTNIFLAFWDRYAPNVALFITEVFGVELDEWQLKVCAAYDRGDRQIAVASAHGPGKTAMASWLAWHHLLFRFPQKTAVTAPSSPQLFDAFFTEFKMWGTRLPPALLQLVDIKADRVELRSAPESSFLTCRTSRADQPEALQGIHSDHVLLIGDEASGIPDSVYIAAAGSMTAHSARTFLISNPTKRTGRFFEVFHAPLGWTTFTVSAFDAPKRITSAYIEEMRLLYGEDSNHYRVRVLGQFPKADERSFIPFDLIESAQSRKISVSPHAPVVWGLDVARYGTDKNVLAIRQGAVQPVPCEVWKGTDLMVTAGRVYAKWLDTPDHERPVEILVDAIGLGAGVADRLMELHLPVRGINVSESPPIREKYRDLKAELWAECREWLATRTVALHPKDAQLAKELEWPSFDHTSQGKLFIESKESLAARQLPSPDHAEAFVLTFASTAATLWGSRDQYQSRQGAVEQPMPHLV